MNLFQMGRLFKTIYFDSPPDIRYLQRLGLLAVKIGQSYAQRPDFLSEGSCRELAKLYRRNESISPATLQYLLKANTSDEWRESFASIEEKPLACASVGQVHRGRLRDGKDVVVKLVKGDFRGSFESDVRSFEKVLRVLIAVYPKLQRVADPLGTLRDVRRGTLAELDLNHEVEGQQRLLSIYRRFRDEYHLAGLSFPRLYESLSNERVLVSEYVAGPTFDELLEANQMSYRTLLDLFQIHGFYLFCAGTFHGDLHPGNVVLRQNKICLLDTGIVNTVEDRTRQGLFRFFDALVVGDFNQSARALESMSGKTLAASRFERFRREFRKLYQGFLGRPVAEVSLTRQMMQTIRLAVDHGMQFETGMFPVVKSLMYLDGMVLRCAPQADLMADLKPFLDRFRPWVACASPKGEVVADVA